MRPLPRRTPQKPTANKDVLRPDRISTGDWQRRINKLHFSAGALLEPINWDRCVIQGTAQTDPLFSVRVAETAEAC